MTDKSFDFDRLTDRRGTLSYKWNVGEGELPMWVADMDFETAPAVKEAIVKRAQHGIFGYTVTPDEFFSAVSDYRLRRTGYALPTEWLIYVNGIVASLSSAVRRLTHPGEQVLIQAPVYNIFYNCILNNGRRVISSDLVYENGAYSIDFADLEAKLSEGQTTLMIVCNPHNPVGRIWTKEELAKIGELCKKHGVTVISDEIHADFIKPGKSFVPFYAASEVCRDISATCISGSKTFNIAGLQCATVAVSNPQLRHRLYRGFNNDEIGEPNCFAMTASIAACTQCDGWVDGLNEYVFENRRIAEEYIRERIPSLSAVSADATYLLWVDCSRITDDSVALTEQIRTATGLYLSDGAEYGESGRCFVRINLATQRERVLDGLSRLEKAVKAIGEI